MASRMGTQHADEVSTNAPIGGKFGGSYSVFARRPLQGAHDALVVNSLDLRRMIQDWLECQPKEQNSPAKDAETAKFFVPTVLHTC